MAGFYFGKSRWDDIPQALGLTAFDDGYMRGPWRGHPVEAHFYNKHDRQRDTYYHYTAIGLWFEPTLGVFGLEGGRLFDHIFEPALREDVTKRAEALGLSGLVFSDLGIDATWSDYQSGVERYRAAFELFAWAAQVVMDRRAKNPPPWEIEIRNVWPSLAQGWGLQLDPRRGLMKGVVQGRTTSARVINQRGTLLTTVEVDVALPTGSTLSLARQEDGFFKKLFRGQDVIVGDPVFDAAFVIKGEPEAFVRGALTPLARQKILELAYAGVSIELKDGKLVAMTKNLLTSREHLDALMKAAYTAAVALCPPPQVAGPQVPYR